MSSDKTRTHRYSFTLLILIPTLLGCPTVSNGNNHEICPTGQTLCSGSCVNLSSDHSNCGSCGNECSIAQACIGGVCTLECPAGETECSGQCFNLNSHHANCGGCGHACSSDEVCNGGMCSSDCATGLTRCGGSCVFLQSDIHHCGACNNECAPGQICLAGSCWTGCGDGTCSGPDGEDTCTCPEDCGERECIPGSTRLETIPECGVTISICNTSCSWESLVEQADDDRCTNDYEYCRYTYECCISFSSLLGEHTVHVEYEVQDDCTFSGASGDLSFTMDEIRGSEEDGVAEGSGDWGTETWYVIFTRRGCDSFDIEIVGGEHRIEATVIFSDPDTMTGSAIGYFTEEWNPLGGPCEMDLSGW